MNEQQRLRQLERAMLTKRSAHPALAFRIVKEADPRYEELRRLRKLLTDEADITRWWLQEHSKWQNPTNTVSIKDTADPTARERSLYILAPPVSNAKTRRRAKYFLAFDATIMVKRGGLIHPFDPDKALDPAGEVKHVIALLRRVRRVP